MTTKKYKSKPKDFLGSREGTIAAQVNRVMSAEPQTVESIASSANIPPRKALARLYSGVHKGHFVKEKTIRFRLSTPSDAKNTDK